MLAHIRSGTLIKIYPDEKGWVDLADGQRASPPVAGFVHGDDRVVAYVEETVASNTKARTTRAVETIVEADRVVRRTTISDVPIETQRESVELDRFEFARAAAAAGFITYEEAAEWAAGIAMPATVRAVIQALPVEAQGPVTLDVLAQPTIPRNGSLMPALIAAFQTDDAGVDALYGLV